MKRYNSIKLSTDVSSMDDIYFDEEMLDFSYQPEEEGEDLQKADELKLEPEEELVME